MRSIDIAREHGLSTQAIRRYVWRGRRHFAGFPRQPQSREFSLPECQKDQDWVWNRRDKDERTCLLRRMCSYHAGLFRYYCQDSVSSRVAHMPVKRLLLRFRSM